MLHYLLTDFGYCRFKIIEKRMHEHLRDLGRNIVNERSRLKKRYENGEMLLRVRTLMIALEI